MTKAAEVGSSANRYEILAKLATGGMAEIFLARGASGGGVERHVVLKRILRNRASDVHFVKMFLDEARLAAQLQHPNVAQVYDIGRLGDSYFFTMEYVHGETVRALMYRAHALKKVLPIGAVLTIATGAAAGLHHAHDRLGIDGRPLGIVHRDVSPSNLMVSYEGNVKVVDFGVAKAEDKLSETRSGTVKGKISYLSPEQCRGGSVDRRSDLFSLGIVLWEMLTTERLYKRASDFDAMTAIVNEEVPPPSSRRPDVPREVDALVLRLLAKRADDRVQSGAELVELLEEVAATTGKMLSTSTLARVLRELFGQRPEPWVEMELDKPDGVTVTSEPIPSELAIPPEQSLDVELNSLPDLSAARARPVEPPSSSRGSLPVFQQPTRLQPVAVPIEALRTPPPELVQPTIRSSQPRGIVVQEAPVTGGLATPTTKDVRPRRVPVIALVLVPAAVIGAVLAVWLSSPSKQVVVADAAVARAEPDAAVHVESIAIDAAVGPVDAAVAMSIDAAVAPIDAAVPLTAADLYAAGRFSDALAACPKAHDPATCTLAACKLRKDIDARRYLAAVPARQRDRVIAACPMLEPPRPPPHHVDPPDPCKADPFACQH